ncbi:MAG TPA: tripartite tricarboxylate transporter substrate binding protein [Xanthobacteraceae bacterium]|nr:tripartite tricarboxylate transporter substrate binding protein [Xanthobacteraceae bacterium]
MRGFYSRVAVAALAGALLISTGPSARADYPNDRTIRVVLGFPAGGGADILARWWVEKLKEVSGATVILENKPGNSGNLAADMVAKSKPDGYTLMFAASASMGASRFLYKNLPYDSQKDFIPITTLAQLPFSLTVAAKSPINTVAELTAYLRAKAPKATYGWSVTSALASSVLYVNAEKLEITPVNYKATGAAVSDVGAGEVDFAFADLPFTLGQQRAGRIKILAVTSDKRSAGAPDIPTMAEAGVPAATTAPWWGAYAPAGTPPEIVAQLEEWFNKAVLLPSTKEFLVTQGADPLPGTSEQMKVKLQEAVDSWRQVTTLAKIQPQ